MFEAKSDNVKQNQKYFVLSSLESKDLDSADIIECDCNHMSIESGCVPDARLQTSAAFESLVQSDLSTSQSTIFNVDAIIPVNKEKVTQGIILDSGATITCLLINSYSEPYQCFQWKTEYQSKLQMER